MKTSVLISGLLLSVLFSNCSDPGNLYQSDQLEIIQLTDQTFVHHSFLTTESFGKVACNGLIYVKDGEAIVFDTPTTDSASVELIQWIQDKLKSKVKAVIVTHFHEDCLGGLSVFHESGIPSYSNELTQQLARDSDYSVPNNGFTDRLITTMAGDTIYSEFLGEGHTKDNIVSYISSEEVLFGGCLIKSLGAGKGYVDDGNTKAWPTTVQAIKDRFGSIEYVVPGHGKTGNTELLDYTIELFR